VVFLDKTNALSRRINKRVANRFKNFWSFEKAIKVSVIDGDFRVKVNTHLSRFLV